MALPNAFRRMVEQELTALGFTPGEWDGTQLSYTAADGKDQSLGLGNLFKRVKLLEQEEIPAAIREFVRNISSVDNPDWKMPDTLDEAADRILPRIGKEFAADVKAPWSQPLPSADGLFVNLVIDFPTTMAYVTDEMLGKSAGTPADWLDRALANLKALTKPDWLTTLRPEQGIMACHTTDSYDAARALLLCELTGNDPAGWLVAVPSRDWLFARKVDISGVPHFHHMKTLAAKAFGEQPYPISDKVFWVRPGKPWEPFRIEFADGKIQLYPPADFVEAFKGPAE